MSSSRPRDEDPLATLDPEDGWGEGPLPVLRPAADRYEVGGEVDRGAMGRVVEAWDRELRRTVALKVMTSRAAGARRRFVREAQIAAQLDHPNVVPIHELGILPTGDPYYAMKLVRGDTLEDVLGSAGRNRLLHVLEQVAMGVGYAHAKGIVHRDIKPANVMVGRHGEVYVMDWGIAKLVGEAPDGQNPEAIDLEGSPDLTVDGSIFGTPEYMSPEQARGKALDPRSDVYALGVVLYEVLTGKSRYPSLPTWEVLRRTAHQEVDPTPLRGPGVPEELGRVCLRALSRDADARFASATELGEAIRAFLEGAERERRADERAIAARAQLGEYRTLGREALAARERLREASKTVGPFDGLEAKRRVWLVEREAEAAEVRREAALARVEELCEQALGFLPGHGPARATLADLYRGLHEDAEGALDRRGAAHRERLLRRYDDGRHGAYLEGTARLRVASQPSGAEVLVRPFVDEDGLLAAGEPRSLGRAPVEADLPFGSYLVVLSREGLAEARQPVLLSRGERLETCIRLRSAAEIGDGFVCVPAGRFVFGGDRDAPASRDRAVPVLGDFAVARFPTTLAEYAEFLNDLAPDAAASRAPKVEGGTGGNTPLWRPDPDGRYRVPFEDSDGDRFEPRFPVALVSAEDADAYAAWRSARERATYRLPTEEEWEKSARGADGRLFPWGNRFDPCLCLMMHSRPGRLWFGEVGLYPADESPYGVRDLAGGVREWTSSPAVEEPTMRVSKGGAFSRTEASCRAAFRESDRPTQVSHYRGFRLVKVLG